MADVILIIAGILLILLALAGRMVWEKSDVKLDRLAARIAAGTLGAVLLGLGLWERFTSETFLTRLSAEERSCPSVVIASPRPNAAVSRVVTALGRANGAAEGTSLWLVVHPIGESGWWPQGSAIVPVPPDGRWEQQASFGGSKGQRFRVVVVCSSLEAHQAFVDYLDEGRRKNDYPGRPLPLGAEVIAAVDVVLDE